MLEAQDAPAAQARSPTPAQLLLLFGACICALPAPPCFPCGKLLARRPRPSAFPLLLQEAAAAALGNLAANSAEAQSLIASAGAIPLLVGVLRGGTDAAKQHAARAIRNLGEWQAAETKRRVPDPTAHPALAALASPACPLPCPLAAGRDTQNKLAVAAAGGLQLLVGLMAGGGGASDASRQAAASALSNVACNCDQTQRQLVQDGALPVVAELLLPGGGCSLACREAAAWALSNLACCPDVRKQLGCAAFTSVLCCRWLPVFSHLCCFCEPPLTAALSPHTQPPHAAPPCSEEHAVLGGMVAGLLELLRGGSDSGGQAAARAIKNLSAGTTGAAKEKIAAAGAIPPLVQLLSSPRDATSRAAASGGWLGGTAPLRLACRGGRRALPAAGAVPPPQGCPRALPPRHHTTPPAQRSGTWPTAATPTARRLCRRAPSRRSWPSWRRRAARGAARRPLARCPTCRAATTRGRRRRWWTGAPCRTWSP